VLGNVYAATRRIPQALQAYTQALKYNEKLLSARYNRAVLLRRLGRAKEALADQDRVLAAQPNNLDALFERALLHASARRFPAALLDLHRLLRRDRNNVMALRIRGKVYGDLGVTTGESDYLMQSEADLSATIQREPAEPDGYRSRGLTRTRAHNWKGALADYKKYLELTKKPDDDADILASISVAYLELGQREKALRTVDAAIKLRPHPDFLGNRAHIHLQTGELAKAVADCDEAIRRAPGYPRAWAFRGIARLRQGRYADALRDLTRVLGLTRTYETLVLRGLAYLGSGDVEAAREDLGVVARERPNHVRGKFARGLLHAQDNKYALAISDLSLVVDDPILGPFALLARARAWLEVGGSGVPVAAADADALARTLPRDGFAHLCAARVHARASKRDAEKAKKRRARALVLLARAVELQPELRKGLAEDAELEALRGDGRFKKLAGAKGK
jgi:tetratricopeptide (TPR) repeat protein